MFVKSIVFALIITIIGFLVGEFVGMFTVTKPECQDWNKYHIMEITLFLIGLVTYYIIPRGYFCAIHDKSI